MIRTTLMILVALLPACYAHHPSKGGGQGTKNITRKVDTGDIALARGYHISIFADSLNFPTSICFDDNGNAYALESGYSYGEVFTEPRLVRLRNNRKEVVLRGKNNGPWTSVRFHEGQFYISEGGELEGGRVFRVGRNGGEQETLVDHLPSMGDHHTNHIAIRNGYLYVAQGTVTNSGVVGKDNLDYGWLKRRPELHDIPCQDLVLQGRNYDDGSRTTGAFVKYGDTTGPGRVIKGATPCSGAIMRIPLSGGELEWVAWGFRNPYGLEFSPNGVLYTTENGYDARGSRPVWGAGDVLWRVERGLWYGWPDYSAGQPINGDEEFAVSKKDTLARLLRSPTGAAPKPAAILAVHSSSNGFSFSTTDLFGFEGNAFIAQFGDLAPTAGKAWQPVGYKVVRVDTLTGVTRDFIVNKGRKNGPASHKGRGGLERPIDIKFSPDGRDMYIVDFGIIAADKNGLRPIPYTGVIWRVRRS